MKVKEFIIWFQQTKNLQLLNIL